MIDNEKKETSESMLKQRITLLNNRSAMYEKATLTDLAVGDCHVILDQQPSHIKARARLLRLLEGQENYKEALVHVCASQLAFMHANRPLMQQGLPLPSAPPVSQQKLEEILTKVVPSVMEPYLEKLEHQSKNFPSAYTILQFVKSYVSYPQWTSQAVKDGSIATLRTHVAKASTNKDKATELLKCGRRHMYEKEYKEASNDFEEGLKLIKNETSAAVTDIKMQLLEWTGMTRHIRYDLDGALECYKEAAKLVPSNSLILVKQAGVQMDNNNHEEANKLFDAALKMDPKNVDALLHRSNLLMIQQRTEDAKKDLMKCIELNPKHVMARLRLTTILTALQDLDGAKEQLRHASKAEPNSSEIHSYRGELYFAQGELADAKKEFDTAIQLEPTNPTPYVNAAMAVLNTPPPMGQRPDPVPAMLLLQKAIDVDPQFTAAYIQLGQLKLGTATTLEDARSAVQLYEDGLKYCRTAEEVKELCGMRALAEAQVEAARLLKMESFNLQ